MSADRRVPPASAPAATAEEQHFAVMEEGHKLTGDYIREHFVDEDDDQPAATPKGEIYFEDPDTGLVARRPAAPTGEEAETLVEQVSAKVHENWMAAKRAAGVASRKLESGEELMVPYDQLSEAAKELDRGTVRTVLAAMPDVTAQATELAALRARVEELETALQFYADPKSWKDGNDWPMCLSDAEVDDGDRARAALAPRQLTGDQP